MWSQEAWELEIGMGEVYSIHSKNGYFFLEELQFYSMVISLKHWFYITVQSRMPGIQLAALCNILSLQG